MPGYKVQIGELNMPETGLSQLLGYRSRKPEILSGKRKLSLGMIRKLYDKLYIPAAISIREFRQNDKFSDTRIWLSGLEVRSEFNLLINKKTKKDKTNILSFHIITFYVARPGFEPRQTEPKSVVLPLYYRAIEMLVFKNLTEPSN